MLVNVESILQTNSGESALTEIMSALTCSTRETDIAGWYQERAALGVIFTEVHKGNGSAPERLISDRVTAALRQRLGGEQIDRVHVSFHVFPQDWDQIHDERLFDSTLYPDLFERDEARRLPYLAKRSVDIVGSLAALALCSPLWIAISVAIKLNSKGPILFRQQRVGRYGSRFTLLKFRSMKSTNDPSLHREYVRRFIAGEADSAQPGVDQKVVYKIQDDPRVSRVGWFLRRTSLDELPQFINVLKGEMSLVGPRPPISYELEAYQTWHQRRMLEAKPGITGLWQVNGRSRLKFDDMVRLDLQYARTWSLWSDLKILLRTPLAMIFCDGAY